MVHKKQRALLAELLIGAQMRVTPQRLAILEVLRSSEEPISIETILKKVGSQANYVTLYRVLKQCVDAGLVYQTDFRSGRAYYELQLPGHHHHHVTCTTCGMRQKTELCHEYGEQYGRVLKGVKAFSRIDSHTLEFFGTCRGCR